jgi:hypothetical protein
MQQDDRLEGEMTATQVGVKETAVETELFMF